MRFAHVATEQDPKGQAAERFKEEVEQRSEGRITVEIFPNSSLYGDEDEMQALQSGAVEVLAPGAAKFGTITPQIQVLDLPFLFESYEEIPEVVSEDSSVGQAIFENEDLAERNIQVLGLWDLGLKQFASNIAVESPEDLQGQEMRIQSGSDVLRSQMTTWGVDPTPMAFAEVYTALQQGVIDGLENTYTSIYSQNMHTVQDYLTVSDHGYIGYVLTINTEFFEGLPEDLQQDVRDAADEASAFNRETTQQEQQEARQNIEEEGSTEIVELSEEERQALKDEVVPEVWEEYSEVIGEDVIEELLEREEQR